MLISYTVSRERYDLIYVDPEYGTVGVVEGEEGVRDASERMPDAGTGTLPIDIRLPLYHARVTASGVSLVPLWNLRAGYARELQAQIVSDTRRNRESLAPLFARLAQGLPTIWSALGDSITALQSDVPSATVPNGQYRDRATATGTPNTYLREGIIDAALVTALPAYDTGDGAGAVHTRFGRMWDLVTAASERFAGAVEYRNYSIAGTNSDDSTLGMTNPTRLAAWAEDGSHVGIIATGMNETAVVQASPTQLFNQVRVMIDAKLEAGADVIVWGCSRPRTSAAPAALWLQINRILRRAAETPGYGGRTAAFIDPTIVPYGPGEGSLGVAPDDLCLANGYNHPGIRQHAIEGALGRAVVFNA